MKRRVLKKRASRKRRELRKWHRRNMSCTTCRWDYAKWVAEPFDAELADRLEALASKYACNVHGHNPDPVIFELDQRVMYACPFCSGSAVRKQWEAE